MNATSSTVGQRIDELIRFWPRPQPSRRLIITAVFIIVTFLALGIGAVVLLGNSYASLSRHGAELVRVRTIALLLYDVKAIHLESLHETLRSSPQRVVPEPAVTLAHLDQLEHTFNELLGQLDQLSRQTDHGYADNLRTQMRINFTNLKSAVSYSGENWSERAQELRGMQGPRMAAERVMDAWHKQALKQRDHLEPILLGDIERTRCLVFATLGACVATIILLGVLLIRYVSKRDAVERRLLRTMELWQGSLHAIKKGLAVFSSDQRLIFWNPSFAELQGIKSAQLRVGMPAAEVIALSVITEDSVQAEQLTQILTGMSRNTGVVDGSSEFIRHDGARIQFSLDHMDLDHYVVTISDITDIRYAEQLARDQAIRLGTIMNNVPDAILTINASGSIESWNKGAEQMFGYTASEIIRRHVNLLMGHKNGRHNSDCMREFLRHDDHTALGRLRDLHARRQDGTDMPVELRMTQMELGKRRMYVAIVRDITQSREIERLKNEFIASVSHELRTPLTSIMGACALLASGTAGELPDKAQRLVTMAEKNGRRLSVLINDILDLEKAEAGRLTVSLAPVSLVSVLRQALEANRSYAMHFNVDLQFIAPAEFIEVMVDETRMMQIMANLLSNAIKYSPAHSAVMITVTLHDAQVRIAVHDSGEGVPEQFRQRVFQRFAQADSTATRRVAGTGLGLAITKQLVELHGGTIGFDSGASMVGSGRGATFWFELPLLRNGHVIHYDLPLDLKVLFCEDDPDVTATVSELLDELGCSVIPASTAAQVHAALNETVDVLLLDIDLPDQHGLALLADLRSRPEFARLPVVVLSAQRMSVAEHTAQDELRIHAWLSKPVDSVVLRSALQAACRKKSGGEPA